MNGICVCIGCGCDDNHACDYGCGWVRLDEPDGTGVCSECPDSVSRWDAGERDLSDEALARLEAIR